MSNIQKAVDSVCGMTMQFKEEDGELILDLSALLEKVAITATELEREECAKVVEQYTGAWDDEGYALAASIRGRK